MHSMFIQMILHIGSISLIGFPTIDQQYLLYELEILNLGQRKSP